MRARVATLILLSLLTFAAGLGRQAITDGDEGYYAEASREMVESGDWLTPHFNYTDRWQKPVLYYWITAATFLVSGPTEWAARGFSAISGVLLVVLTYRIGRRMFEDDDAAWVGAAIVATSGGYFALARLGLPDLPLALFITLSIYLWLERQPALAGVAAGLGFLDKGPLALVIPALVLLPIAWREHRWRTADVDRVSLRVRDFAIAALTFTIVGLPWYGAMIAEHGRPYLQSFFIGDNLERFATDRFNSPRAVWFYVPILIGGLFPWMAYLLVLPWRRGIDVLKRTTALTANEWRLIVWTLAPLLFFTASIGKQPRYILPVLPPLALLLGSSIAKRVRQASAGGTTRGLTISAWATAVIYVLLAALLFRARPVLINSYPLLTLAGVIGLVLGAVTLAWTAISREWRTLPTRMAITAVTTLLAVQFGALAGARPEAVEIVADLVRSNWNTGERIGIYQTLTRNLIFYTGIQQVDLFDDQQVITFLNSNERVLLVARARDVLRLQSMLGFSLRAIGSVDYIDPATIRLSTLISPSPDDDITDVMLVSNK